MALPLALAAVVRLQEVLADETSALGQWVQSYGETPRIDHSYRRPPGADGWPFLAVVPGTDRRNLLTLRAEAGGVILVAGYRLHQVERGEGDGILALSALADAALEALGRRWRVDWGRERWDARVAERLDTFYQHPMYETEIRIDFGRVGVDVASYAPTP